MDIRSPAPDSADAADAPPSLKERALHLWTLLSGSASLHALPKWRRKAAKAGRIMLAAIRDVVDGQLSLRAMSLVYTTLLSLVPFLAVSFSVLKGFGVHNQIEPFLLGLTEGLGPEQSTEVTQQIISFVDNVNIGYLGAVGLAVLFYTILSLMRKVEGAFNYSWHVSRGRGFGQSFTTYLSVILVGPMLIFVSLSMTATVANNEFVASLSATPGLDRLIEWGGRLVPYLIVVLAFTFLYTAIPNTKVKAKSAFIGALVGGLLWQLAGIAFTELVAQSGSYAVYAAFATLVIFMFWLYISWLILLFGASIAFYHQKPQYTHIGHEELRLSARARETIALAVMREVAQRFYDGGAAWTANDLAQKLDAPDAAVDWTLKALVDGGFLSETGDNRLLPARAPDVVPVAAVLETIRQADDTGGASHLPLPQDSKAAELLVELDEARRTALQDRTVKSLMDG